ncbi:MAG: hypothetical protein AAF399_22770, partial [Bacteroidota bacterium]
PMKDQQRILSFFIPQTEYELGPVDITARLYQQVPKDEVELIKYTMATPAEKGVYYTVVFLHKEVQKQGSMGFKGA